MKGMSQLVDRAAGVPGDRKSKDVEVQGWGWTWLVTVAGIRADSPLAASPAHPAETGRHRFPAARTLGRLVTSGSPVPRTKSTAL